MPEAGKLIGIDARVPIYRGRGWERYAVDFLSALSQLDLPYRVRVLAPDNARGERLALDLDGRLEVFFDRFELGAESDYMLAGMRARDPLECFGEVDLLHFLTPFGVPTRARRLAATIHDVSPLVDPPFKTEILGSTLAALKQLRASNARIISVSATTRSELVGLTNISPERITVVHPGLTEGFEAEAPTTKRSRISEPRLIYVGGMGPNKNLKRLIECIIRLRKTRPVSLLVVGDSRWGYHELVRELEQFGGNDWRQGVTFHGFVPDDDLRELYRGSHGLVMPSLHEGFGLPLLEAMATGLPVCCSAIPVFEEVADGAALFFNPHDVTDMSATIESLLYDEKLAADLRRRGLARAEKFDWRRSAQTIAGIYAEELVIR